MKTAKYKNSAGEESRKDLNELILTISRAVDAMRVTQRLFGLSDGHVLMSRCRDLERWLEEHTPRDGD